MGHAERWVSEILEEKLREQRRRTKEGLRFLVEKKKRKGKLTWRDIDKAMGDVLCFGGLQFCCSLKHPCGQRDSLLKALGLTKKDYTDYKEMCQGVFWLMLAEKKII